jgi:hypothetical protein
MYVTSRIWQFIFVQQQAAPKVDILVGNILNLALKWLNIFSFTLNYLIRGAPERRNQDSK